jgi:GAF domain-containing protein
MQSAETLTNLQKFLKLLDPSLRLEEMLTNVARQLVEMFEVDHSGVLFFGNEDLEGIIVAEYPAQNLIGVKFPLTNYPLVDQLKAEQKPIAVFKAQEDPLMGDFRVSMRNLGIQSILIIPLIVKDKLIGGLGLDAISQPRHFSPDELELCHIIGKQIAVAVDYTRALEAAEESQRQAQTLRQINRVLSETLNLDEILPLILEQLEQVIPFDGSSIYLIIESGIQVKAWRAPYSPYKEQQVIPVDELWGISEIVKHKTPVLVSNTDEHPNWKIDQYSPIKAWLGIPLIVRGELVGVLNIDSYTAHQFKEADIPLAQAFAQQAALAIHNARLYGQAQKRANTLALVQEIGLSIMSSLELEEVLRAVATSVFELLEAHYVRIFLYDPDSDTFTRAAVLDRGNEAGLTQIKIIPPRKDGLTATVARSGQYFAIADTRQHPLFLDRETYHDFRAIIGVPMKKREQVLGVFIIFYKEPHQFKDEELNLLQLLATQAAVAIENARLYALEQARLEDEARRSEQWRRMQEITSTLNVSLDRERVLNNACEQLVRLYEVDHCAIVFLNEGELSGRIVAEYPLTGAVGIHIPLDYPAFRQLLTDLQPFASFNAPEDPLFGQSQATLKRVGVKSILIAPLMVQGRVIGSVGLDMLQERRRFSEEELNMIRVVADQIAIALENARLYEVEVKQIERELDIARQIQRGFFPKRTPDIPGWTIAAACLPARETGGDFFDFVERPDGGVGVVVGDVSGKSIPAAMLMAAAQSFVSAKGSDYRSPAVVLQETNRLIYEDVPKGSFVAASYALLSPDCDEVCLSNAGQLSPYLVSMNDRPNQLIETSGPRFPLGVIPSLAYQEIVLTLAPGDALVFCTDGLVECHDRAGRMFGFDGMGAILEELRGQPPEVMLRALLAATDQFTDGLGSHDDVTLVIVQRMTNSE